MVTEEAFITLYSRHEPELRSFARSLMLQREEAADVLQEACVAMWRKIDTLENERAFRRWGYSYVRLTALNHRRKKHASPLRFTGGMLEIIADEWEDESEWDQAERDALACCLEQLPEVPRHLLSLYYAAPKTTVVDLSERLKRPVAGIYKALERTRSALRVCVRRKLNLEGIS
jgi:RNA polymerase sigma-70 factor (ECF subfamily)